MLDKDVSPHASSQADIVQVLELPLVPKSDGENDSKEEVLRISNVSNRNNI